MAPRQLAAAQHKTNTKSSTKKSTKTYKQWTEIDLTRSVAAVREGHLSKKAVPRVYGVPEGYLRFQIKKNTASSRLYYIAPASVSQQRAGV
ncbi:hypothetical protein V7S43_011253 [Phytophthora oleae]|uniref:HTH psq-type domain-containing protein n=1 Tax=Phytophthora oleae TaxID=2107226 RepID=A0ABD3FAC8_9STRA